MGVPIPASWHIQCDCALRYQGGRISKIQGQERPPCDLESFSTLQQLQFSLLKCRLCSLYYKGVSDGGSMPLGNVKRFNHKLQR